MRLGDELVPWVFVAKSIKFIFPSEIMMDSGMFIVLRVKGVQGPMPVDADAPAVFPRVLPQSQGACLKCPPSGPPKEFFDRFGTSRDCSACRSMDDRGTCSGLSHSKKCCDRYERWLKIQISGDDHGIDPASIETLEPDLDEPIFGNESTSDLGVSSASRLRRVVEFSDETETGNVPNETETANVRSETDSVNARDDVLDEKRTISQFQNFYTALSSM